MTEKQIKRIKELSLLVCAEVGSVTIGNTIYPCAPMEDSALGRTTFWIGSRNWKKQLGGWDWATVIDAVENGYIDSLRRKLVEALRRECVAIANVTSGMPSEECEK